jgi:hypothetical protein
MIAGAGHVKLECFHKIPPAPVTCCHDSTVTRSFELGDEPREMGNIYVKVHLMDPDTILTDVHTFYIMPYYR